MNINSTAGTFESMSLDWLKIAKELQSIAQAGLTYGSDKYDIDRYKQIRELSIRIIDEYSAHSFVKIHSLFEEEEGYLTPKVDIRSVVFRKGKILMVRESIDGKWVLL